jgi:hypothetical protein
VLAFAELADIGFSIGAHTEIREQRSEIRDQKQRIQRSENRDQRSKTTHTEIREKEREKEGSFQLSAISDSEQNPRAEH